MLLIPNAIHEILERGRKQGREEGRKQGREVGREEGRREVLERLERENLLTPEQVRHFEANRSDK